MTYLLPLKLTIAIFLLTALGCSSIKNHHDMPKPNMIRVEGGSFIMGDVIDSTNTDALPLHNVNIEDFYIAQTETTFEQYDAFAKATGRSLPEDDYYGRGQRAVSGVNWYDASAYCKYWGWRLPTEAEWEYAARDGGTKIAFAGTNNPDSLANYAITSSDDLSFSFRVATKKPNALGLFDMSGNVFEWIGQYYQFYEKPNQLHDLKNSSMRVLRGGSFHGRESPAKVYWRVGVLADNEPYDTGFRCAVSQEELNEQKFLNGFFHRKPIRP